jgi:hypothetical protein
LLHSHKNEERKVKLRDIERKEKDIEKIERKDPI